jgi:hypothetical protein
MMFVRAFGVAVVLSGAWAFPAFADVCIPFWTLSCSSALDPVRNAEEMLELDVVDTGEKAVLSVDDAGRPFVRMYVHLITKPGLKSYIDKMLKTKASALETYRQKMSAEGPDALCWYRPVRGNPTAKDLNKFISAGGTVKYNFVLWSRAGDGEGGIQKTFASFHITDCGRP